MSQRRARPSVLPAAEDIVVEQSQEVEGTGWFGDRSLAEKHTGR